MQEPVHNATGDAFRVLYFCSSPANVAVLSCQLDSENLRCKVLIPEEHSGENIDAVCVDSDVSGHVFQNAVQQAAAAMGSVPVLILENGVSPVATLREAIARVRDLQSDREILELGRCRRVIEGSHDGIWEWELASDEFFASARWFEIHGLAQDVRRLRSAEWFDRLHPDDAERLRGSVSSHIAGLSPRVELECRVRHTDGVYRWVHCRAVVSRDTAGVAQRLSGAITEITGRKLIEEQLLHDALHDSLTGLANRTLFLDRLAHRLARWRADRHREFAVLFLDLDRFKMINDSMGHLIGDQLLMELGRRFRGAVSPAHTLARLGGDEFTILLEEVRDAGEATSVAARIAEVVQAPVRLGEQDVYPTVSIGIALSTANYQDSIAMLRDADAAMYRAKAQGRACAVVFEHGMHSSAMSAFLLEHDLRAAVQHGEFLMHYQPIVVLQSRKLAAFETLVRWQHPVRGLLAAEEFMRMAEETGLIVAIDDWMLESALVQCRKWFGAGPFSSGLGMNINLSPASLLRPDFPDRLHEMLRTVRIDSRRINLELTERMLVERGTLSEGAISRLRSLNVGMCLDDFGIGYSSLSYLARFPITQLKIDGSFVKAMNTADRHQVIIGTIIRLARSLGIAVIAEGIETEAQARELQAMGCQYGQGFHFSPPLHPEAAEELVRQSKLASSAPA